MIKMNVKEYIHPYRNLFMYPVSVSEYIDDKIYFEQYNYNYTFYMTEEDSKKHYDTLRNIIYK